MPSVSILIHASGEPQFETTDARTIDAIRDALEPLPVNTWLIPAHELAEILLGCGRGLWAGVLLHEEEAHMVTVQFSP